MLFDIRFVPNWHPYYRYININIIQKCQIRDEIFLKSYKTRDVINVLFFVSLSDDAI